VSANTDSKFQQILYHIITILIKKNLAPGNFKYQINIKKGDINAFYPALLLLFC